MKYRGTGVVMAAVVAVAIVGGCGVSQKQLDEAEQRIEQMMAKGVPDSLLTDAKVLLVNARAAVRTANSALAKQNADSMFAILDSVDAWYQTQAQELAPKVDQLQSTLAERKAELSGPQLGKADSLLGIVDSLKGRNWMLQAHEKLTGYQEVFDQLVVDEARMKEVVAKLPGKWAEQEVSADKSLGLVRTKLFEFGKDGSVEFIEKEKGKHDPSLKVDWKYISYGKWHVYGDTVYVDVDREERVHQIGWMKDESGKWKKESKPPYDSTITDDHKDFTITFTYMEEEM
ncbi:MAG: hypothetical protein GF331_05260, partial [Chitinivibrionales bacterium]|nr:hypothetical protein [Chitinivibrionales bacterium]